MKKSIIISISLLFLFSCGVDENIVSEVEKREYMVDTIMSDKLSKQYTLTKSTKIESNANIDLTSQVPGRVKDIYVKEGDRVEIGSPLVILSDSVVNLTTGVTQAKLNLEKTQINYDSNKISLDKMVSDSSLNLSKIQNNYESLKKNVEQNLVKAKNDLNNSDTQSIDSKSTLDIEKLDNTISKMKLDYDNKLIADKESMNGFLSSLKNNKNSLTILIDDIIEFGDSLLGVTDINSDDNDSFENFIGAKDRGQKSQTEDLLKNLISYKENQLLILNIESIENIDVYLEQLNQGFEESKIFLNNMEQTLNSSIPSVGTFSEANIATHIATINGYQSSLQANFGNFIVFYNSTNSFLRTYLNNQQSLLQQIELTQIDRDILEKALSSGEVNAQVAYNNTVINSMDGLSNVEVQLKNAQANLDNAIENREVTLRSLENSIKNARLGLDIAQKDYNKLILRSPVNGIVADVSVDKGQEYPNGTSMVKILSTGDGELVVAVPQDQLKKISILDEVVVRTNNNTFTGTVYAKSNLADNNLNYKIRIQFDEAIELVGNIASIDFQLLADYPLVPINSVKILTGNSKIKKGEIPVLIDGVIKKFTFTLGEVYGDMIEILDEIPANTEIITSDVVNFDHEKFILKISKSHGN